MPIDIARQTTDSPIRRYQNTLAGMNNRRVSDPLAESIGDPDVLGQAWRSFTRDSIVGSAITDFIPYQLGKTALDGEVDPEFDVLKFIDEDYLRANPHMVDPLASGDLFDIPNRERFLWYSARAKEDYDIRQRLGTESLGGSILTALPGQLVDTLVGGLALRGIGLAGKAAQAGEWLKSGSFAARTGKAAIMGGALNLAQEEALRALNPSRHVDEGQAALWAVGLGAAFGSGAHMLASGKTKLGRWLDPIRAKLISQQVAADLSDPKFHGIDEQAAADAEILRAEMNGFTVYRGNMATLPSGRHLSDYIDPADVEGEVPKPVVNLDFYTTSKEDAVHYASNDQLKLSSYEKSSPGRGAEVFKNLHGHEPRGIGTVSESKIYPRKTFDMTAMGTRADQFSFIRMVNDAIGNKPLPEKFKWSDVPDNVNKLIDGKLKGAMSIGAGDGGGPEASWSYLRNRANSIDVRLSDPSHPNHRPIHPEKTIGTDVVQWLSENGYDSIAYMHATKNGPVKHIATIRSANTGLDRANTPPGLSVGASTPAGTKLREGEIKHAHTEVPLNHIAATRSAQTGRPYSATVHRGVVKGRIATDTSDSVGNALFFTPDIETARIYSAPTKGGTLVTKEVNLANPLVADNWFEAKSAIGLPRKTTMEDLIRAARKAGHDGLVFTANHNTDLSPEVVVFDPSLLKDTKTSPPPGLSVGAATPAGTKLREGEIKHFTVLRTPLTEKYIKEIEDFYGKDNVEWGEHPQQYAADMQEALRAADEEVKKYAPADLGMARNAVVKTLGAVTPARKLYNPNINPSSFSRLVSRVLFDFTLQTQEGFDNPISGQTFVPAEGLRMVYNGWASEARLGLEDAFREAWQAKATHRMLDGRDVTIGRLSKKDFSEAVTEYKMVIHEAARGHRAVPENVHPAIAKAAAIDADYYRKIGMDGKASGYLKDMEDPSLPHFTHQWLTDKIERNPADFKQRLIAEWEYNRNVDFATGQVMDPEVRTLKNDVVNPENVSKGKNAGGLTDADREAINKYAKDNERPLEEVTEIDLRDEFGPELAGRYEQEVQIYFDKAADSTIESLTKIVSARHGVLDAMDEIPADVRKGRLLKINPTRFSEYLERDSFRLLESYDHIVSGRVASRMAVKRNAKLIDPFYKELMGHSIAADDYNPAKLIEAVNKHFQQFIGDERLSTQLRDRFSKARDVILGEKSGVLTNKLAELERRASGSPVGWQLFLDRNLPRMPFFAQMGKMTFAAFGDISAISFGRRIGNEQISALRTVLKNFRGAATKDIEGAYVATIDQIRTLRGDDLPEYVPNLNRGRFGGGLAGSAMSVMDTSLDWLQKKFVSATLINKWSQGQRRTFAHAIMQDIIVGAKKMHAASNLVGQGFTQDKAFAKVGLAIEDARRLNRLGFNAERSKRLLEQIDAHGVDAFGNKVDSTHDGYISPEMSKWWRDDRDLFDTLNTAVNSETLNLIVEPKILSRPLINNTLIGKLFNQFQGFAMAWGTQLAPLAMQRGGHEIAMYASLMFGLGAIADALRNELTGRRTIDDSIKQWQENPVGMAYGAIDRSGLTGWLSRPLGALEHTPVGIGKMLKNDKLSSAYGRPGDFVDQFGPVFGWSNKVYTGVVGSMYDGGWNRKNQMLLWRATPFNNLWAVEGFNRAAERMGFDTPIGPTFQYRGGR